ncbi:hypothetical protein AK830_g9335 [Neonectria ditissima]|uniref:Uncharacterized protein n=1 Tax=Neonectria ditissima TaxID=78410 RepID=A0A0P7B9R3_9HYPO|nr:hypothetical protein AK830_g9335 [Neonectria ditissima]
MEARSLTSVNNLAANPPQYPVNPTDERQDPLTLYISRVPGTRDVILSPFKPQLKIVSSEDVASCLYYIHLEQPSSDLSGPTPPRDDGFRSSSDEGSSRNIPRKPLPGSAKPMPSSNRDQFLPVPSNENQDPMRRRGHTINSTYDTARSTLPSHDQDPRLSLDGRPVEQNPQSSPLRRQNTISRKPHGPRNIGPRAMRSPTPLTDKPLPAFPEPHVELDDGDRVPFQTPNPKRGSYTTRSPSPRKQGDFAFTNPFTLALIRRDPSTGNQWNVGHVSSYQSETPQPDHDESGPFLPNVPPVAQAQTPAANPPINIQIETLGYGRFRNMPARRSFDIGPGDGIPAEERVPHNEGAVLSRQVVMGYAKSWSTNFREKWNEPREHSRHGSVTSVNSVASGELLPEPQTALGQPGPGMRPRGYVFTSPWNGRCEFRTGTTGRSLRCYHILRDDKPALNALVEQGVPVQQLGGNMALSELRFNLPSAELFKSPEGREEVKAQLQGHFNKLLQKLDGRNDSDEDDGMVSPFDVNLGKEKAGGGNRGKRAKMGKLIIYPDGMKMLDLVVAANMGLWWRAWEKSF